MKKLIFFSILALSLITSKLLFSTVYTIKTENGAKQGYDFSKYTIDDNGDVTIICKNPGYEKLPLNFAIDTKSKSTKIVNAEKTLEIILSKIKSGNLTGNEIINGTRSSWKVDSKDLFNAEIIIKQYFSI